MKSKQSDYFHLFWGGEVGLTNPNANPKPAPSLPMALEMKRWLC